MLHGYIVDPETGKVVAVIRDGEVFRQDEEGAKIATVVNGNLYNLSGNFVGRLDREHVVDVSTWRMPIAFRDLLKGKALPSAFTPHKKSPHERTRQGSSAIGLGGQEIARCAAINTTAAALFRPQIPGSSSTGSSAPGPGCLVRK